MNTNYKTINGEDKPNVLLKHVERKSSFNENKIAIKTAQVL